jgi:hypothetical protein
LGLFENPAFLRRRIEYLAHPSWRHRRLRWIAAATAAILVTLFIMPMTAVKAAPEPQQLKPPSNLDVVRGGVGWGAAHIGATRTEVLAAFGAPEDSQPYWSNYGKRLGIDVFYGELKQAKDSDKAVEIRFNPGFNFKLTTGIGIGSSTKEVFDAYGRPLDIRHVPDQSSGLFDNQVLYGLPEASKIIYDGAGVLFWFDKSDRVSQFVVFARSRQKATREDEDIEAALHKKVSLFGPTYPLSYAGAPTDKLSVQYAVIEIAKQAGLEYNWNESYKNTDPICRRWVHPDVHDQTCNDALRQILSPVGLSFRIENGQIVLVKAAAKE